MTFEEDGGEFSRLEIPVSQGPGIDENWLMQQPPVLSDYDRQKLERLGYRVDQRRRLWPIRLDDGRHLVLPVDQVDVHYVGYERY